MSHAKAVPSREKPVVGSLHATRTRFGARGKRTRWRPRPRRRGVCPFRHVLVKHSGQSCGPLRSKPRALFRYVTGVPAYDKSISNSI
ncbi:hypothetical protein GW17_00053430 [Ensete ventricosum]|nr:hypothetical protein GW17_00053430 [Ensete ventricosum]